MSFFYTRWDPEKERKKEGKSNAGDRHGIPQRQLCQQWTFPGTGKIKMKINYFRSFLSFAHPTFDGNNVFHYQVII